MNELLHIIGNIAVGGLLVAATIGFRRYRLLDRGQRLVLLLTLLALLMEGLSQVLHAYGQPNLFLAPLDTALEGTLLALLYRWALRPSRLSRFIPWGIAAFLVGSGFSIEPRFDVTEFNVLQRTAEAVALLGLACTYLYRKVLRDVSPEPLVRDSLFWVSAGCVLYFSGSLLVFLSSNYVLHLSRQLSMRLWVLHGLLYTVLNACYAVALACAPRPGGPVVTQS